MNYRRQQSRGNTFAGDVSHDRGDRVRGDVDIKKIAAYLLARYAAALDPGEIALHLRFGGEAALNGGGDGHLLVILTGGLLRLYQLGAFQDRCALVGQGAQNLMAHPGKVAGSETAVYIKDAVRFSS